MSEILTHVDGVDNVLGPLPADELREGETFFRASVIWVTSPEGRVLLTQRSRHKMLEPERWSAAAAGKVRFGESYGEAAAREGLEEIGLAGVPLIGAFSTLPEPEFPFACKFFYARIREDYPLRLDQAEVVRAQWVSVDEMAEALRATPERFTRFFQRYCHACEPLLAALVSA